MQRRDFFKASLLGAASLTVIGSLFKATRAYALELIDMTGKSKNPANKSAVTVAKGLNYVDDLEKAIKDKKITKAEKKMGGKTYTPAQQICSTCNFYKKTKDGVGTCTLIPGVLVQGAGSCNSWIPGAKA